MGIKLGFLFKILKKVVTNVGLVLHRFTSFFYSYIETFLNHEAIPLSKQEPKISKSSYFKIKFGSSL